jgi:hypothetical protein
VQVGGDMNKFRLIGHRTDDKHFLSVFDWLIDEIGPIKSSESVFNPFERSSVKSFDVDNKRFTEICVLHFNFCQIFSAIGCITHTVGDGWELFATQNRAYPTVFEVSPFVLDIGIEDEMLALQFKLTYSEYMNGK